jgi:hypothetical protein
MEKLKSSDLRRAGNQCLSGAISEDRAAGRRCMSGTEHLKLGIGE